jgi:hypothetical protein
MPTDPANTSGTDLNIWQIRSYLTKGENEAASRRTSYPHSHPMSTFVAQIGANYDPGVWQKIIDMVVYTQQQGIQCWLEEIMPQHGGFPFVDIGGMRDSGVLRAQLAGFEYVCLVDSDILPEPDLLVRLLNRNVSIVGPHIIEPGVNETLGNPQWDVDSGLCPCRWICASMVLFRTSVFNCPNTSFSTGNDDDLFFQQLWKYGHQPYMDTDAQLAVTRPPQRSGARSWDERWERMKTGYSNSKTLPDRGPIDPDNPKVLDGVYVPFAFAGATGRNGDESTTPLIKTD